MKSVTTIKVFLVMFSLLFLGWTQNDSPDQSSKIVNPSLNNTTNPCLTINGPGLFLESIKTNTTLNYTKLKLTKDQYNILLSGEQFKKSTSDTAKNKNGSLKKNAIVFQFAYLSQAYPYAQLRAYPMKVQGQTTTFGLPVDLDFENTRPAPDLSICTEHVTGDLQITFGEMELLKEESNPVGTENYQYFLFTPKFDDISQHVYFEISVFPSTSPDLLPKTRILNPSPPYSG